MPKKGSDRIFVQLGVVSMQFFRVVTLVSSDSMLSVDAKDSCEFTMHPNIKLHLLLAALEQAY